MATTHRDTTTQPLILELLARRNWFKPKQLEEIEEMLQKAGPGTLPEVALIRAGHISEQEIATIYAEDLFLPVISQQLEAGAIDKELGGLLPEKLCIGSADLPAGGPRRRARRRLRLARGDGRRRRAPAHDRAADQSDDRPVVGRPEPARRPLPDRSRTPRASARGPKTSTSTEGRREGRRREHPQPRRDAPPGRQRPDHPHGQPDPRAGPAQRGQRHPPRAVRGRLQVPPPDRRRAPRAAPAVEDASSS